MSRHQYYTDSAERLDDGRRIMRTIVALGLGVILWMVVGEMSYEDEVLEHEHYCRMVSDGHWPDYKNISDGCTDIQRSQK